MTPNALGIHALVFGGGRSREDLARAAEGAAKAGFSVIEVPLLDPDAIDPAAAEIFEMQGLTPIFSLGLDPTTDISGADPDAASRGEDVLMRAIAKAADLGAPLLTGVLYGLLGRHDQPASRAGRSNAQRVLERVAAAGALRGVTVAVEPVNRYESNLLNTVEQGLVFLDEIGAENIVLHIDTYHMNIEEQDLQEPVIAAGARLGYVHVGESHRGYLGTGSIDFPSFFRALRDACYSGPITFEAFSTSVASRRLTAALAIWRDLWTDPDDLAQQAHDFVARQLIDTARAV